MSEFFEKTKRGRGRAKHAVLDQYLKGFFAIQCQCKKWNTPVVYIDGFAGPGTYKADENSNEEEGSPIVAYRAVAEHSLLENFRKRKNSINLIFVEKDKERADKLKRVLSDLERTKTDAVKEIVQFKVVNDDFVSFLEGLIHTENEEFVNSPMFVFADPFGYAGNLIPMQLFKRLMDRQVGQWLPTEVFITVMDGFARRFISDARKSSALTALMGYDNWQHLTDQHHLTPTQRRDEFIELYISNIKRDKELFTLKFGMKDGRNRHIYHLIYVTSHIKGIQTMKPAMWKKTQTSTDMVFSEWVENRNEGENLIDKSPDQVVQCVYALIEKKYRGEVVRGKDLDEFIWLGTPYISNVKNPLKKILKKYAINKEIAFEKIVYRFPPHGQSSTSSQSSTTGGARAPQNF